MEREISKKQANKRPNTRTPYLAMMSKNQPTCFAESSGRSGILEAARVGSAAAPMTRLQSQSLEFWKIRSKQLSCIEMVVL